MSDHCEVSHLNKASKGFIESMKKVNLLCLSIETSNSFRVVSGRSESNVLKPIQKPIPKPKPIISGLKQTCLRKQSNPWQQLLFETIKVIGNATDLIS